MWFGWLTQRLCRILLLHPRHHQTLIKRKRSGQSLSTTSVETLCCQTPAQRRTATVATNLVGGGCAKAMELVQIELVLAPSHVSCRVIANIVSARFFVQGNFAGQLGDGAAIYLGEVGSTRVAAFAAFAAFAFLLKLSGWCTHALLDWFVCFGKWRAWHVPFSHVSFWVGVVFSKDNVAGSENQVKFSQGCEMGHSVISDNQSLPLSAAKQESRKAGKQPTVFCLVASSLLLALLPHPPHPSTLASCTCE